jgi:hypothetical protein
LREEIRESEEKGKRGVWRREKNLKEISPYLSLSLSLSLSLFLCLAKENKI